MWIAQQRKQFHHPAEVERRNVIAQTDLLLVVSPLKKVLDGLVVVPKGLFALDLGDLGRTFFRSFLSDSFH